MNFFIDHAYIRDHEMSLTGWAAPEHASGKISYSLFGPDGRERELTVYTSARPDIGYAMFRDPEREDIGFFLRFPYTGSELVTLSVTETDEDGTRRTYRRSLSRARIACRMTGKKISRALAGPYGFLNKVRRKLSHETERNYQAWFQAHRASSEELLRETEEVFPEQPLISILTPLYHTPVSVFLEMADSVLRQTYARFELILVNATPEDEELSRAVLEKASSDPRIRVLSLDRNLGISGNTNEALREARGVFVALLDHDDVLEPDALYRYVRAFNEDRTADVFYSDEDKIIDGIRDGYDPYFKPDWNPDLLRANNYICHFLMLRTALVREAGGFRPDYDGAQDHDLLLRLTEKTDKIIHIPRILYHWRSSGSSTAKDASKKAYASDTGLAAINDHYRRTGIPATGKKGQVPGWYVTDFHYTDEPLVSVIIPNKDHRTDLKRCLTSLYKRSAYQNIEVLVIENNSTDPATFTYYDEIEMRYPNLRVLRYGGEFNYSAINNYGVRNARGEYVLLLNNDVQADSPDFLTRMAAYLRRSDVGCVGARLLYPDRTVQHAGVIVGPGGITAHVCKGLKESAPGYMCRAITTMDVSAVTAACLLVRKAVYDEVGGFGEDFPVAFNDVDFCLKLRSAGYLVVYSAEATLIHAESKSRGVEDTPEKFLRFRDDVRRLNSKWKAAKGGPNLLSDPYYNPNFSYLSYFELDR